MGGVAGTVSGVRGCRTGNRIWGVRGRLPVTARVLDGLEKRLFGGGAAKAAVAGDVGVGEAKFRAAARDLTPEFFERDRFRAGGLRRHSPRPFHSGYGAQDNPNRYSGEGRAAGARR